MKAKSYRDLEIYNLAHTLAVKLHIVTLRLPKFELFEEGSQIRRSSKSISVNIVEAFSRRRYKAEFVKYLVYALGSCDETIEHLKLLHETGSATDEQSASFLNQYELLGRKINSFIKVVEKSHLDHQYPASRILHLEGRTK